MKALDKRTGLDLVKLLIFIVVTTMVTGLLVIAIGNISFAKAKQYEAVFSDATSLVKGDDIRIAGVRVGSVSDVSVYRRTEALVTFKVDANQQLTRGTHAAIRYRNLVGERYVSLSQGQGGPQILPAGATIPLSHTTPALDLTVLFDGFKPLFTALTPDDVNKLAYEIIRVFQGEGGTLQTLLANTASVTNTLADRDAVIGSLITHLNSVMSTVANRDGELSDLLVRLREFVSGLSHDRHAIFGSLDSVSQLAVQTSDLVTGIRPGLTTDVHQLRKVAGTLDANKAEINRALQVLPIKLTKMGRTASYGSWFNFYLCNFEGRIRLPAGQSLPVDYNTGGARCSLG